MKTPKPKPSEALLHRIFDIQLRKGDLKKIEIIEATIRCLATRGIEETSLEAIGKTLKISRSHIVYYFKDREALLDAVVRYVTETGQNLFVERLGKAQGSPEKLLELYVGCVFEWVEKYEDHVRFMLLFQYFCTFNERYRSLHTRIREAAMLRIQSIIEPMFEGKTKKQAPLVAQAIECALLGYFAEYLSTDRKLGLAAYRERAWLGIQASLPS